MTSSGVTDAIVVGAGIAGLSTAYELRQRGMNVLVLEASTRLGGRVFPIKTTLDSFVDLGGQWIGYGHHHLIQYATKASADVYKVYKDSELPTIVHRHRQISAFSPSVLIAVVYLIFLDVLSRIYIPRSWHHITVEQAISRTVPGEVARMLLRFLIAISSTAELEHCSVYSMAKSLPVSGGFLTLFANHGGAQDSLMSKSTGAIVDMLSNGIGEGQVIVNSPVDCIEYDRAGGVVVHTAGQSYKTRAVILTVPPPGLRKIAFKPELPSSKQHWREMRMGVVYKAIAIYKTAFWRQKKLGEILVLDDPAFGAFDTSTPAGPGHLTILVPGSPALQLDSMSQRERQELLLSALAPHMGRMIMSPLEWHEKSWQTDEFCEGGYLAWPIPGAKHSFVPLSSTAIDGKIFWAGTETADEHPGYIEGAIQSGKRAAGQVASVLGVRT